MEYFRPHTRRTFEGYYSKFHLSSGSHIALIICSVPEAPQRPHMISFTYYPGTSKSSSHNFQKEIWVDRLDMLDRPLPGVEFELRFECGFMRVENSGTTVWEVKHDDFEFRAVTDPSTQVPWLKNQLDTPEGLLAKFPLPLHWHVQSLSSRFTGKLRIKGSENDDSGVDTKDKDGEIDGVVHQEKNWASSFPSAHIWIQARKEPNLSGRQHSDIRSGIVLAGGKTLGTKSYLMSYHSSPSMADEKKRYNVTTRPPFSTELTLPVLAGLTRPFTKLLSTSEVNYPARQVDLGFFCPSSWPVVANTLPSSSVTSPTGVVARVLNGLTTLVPCLPPYRYITIKAKAPKDTFFGLAAPFPDGHRPNFLAQSFRAEIEVNVFELEDRVLIDFGYWLGMGRNKYALSIPTHWRKVHEEVFEKGSLEFGADWYGDRSELASQ